MTTLLPAEDTPWPPPSAAARYRRMRKPRAWYSGDPEQLRAAYGRKSTAQRTGGMRTTLNPGGGAQRVLGSNGDAFWADAGSVEQDTRRHLPIAQDIATISADQLFSDPPSILSDGPLDADGQPTLETRAAQQRLDYVLDRCNATSMLIAAAEVSSALGSIGLRIAFDKTAKAIAGRPVITRVNADAVIPHYSWGQLIGVTFWQVVSADADRDEVWRHLEVHESGTGMVYHALFKGTAASLGKRRPLADSPATAGLAGLVDSLGGIRVVAAGTGKTATSIPNMLPDPANLDDNAGRSDFTLPVMDLFEAADKAYTQMMDEVDDAKSRLFIADSLLERGAVGAGVSFNPDQRLYRKVKVPPSEQEPGVTDLIEKVQFEMRVEQYLSLIDALTYKAIDAAGFNPNTERESDGGQMTATEYSGKNAKTRTTRDKKVRYWESELEDLLTTLVQVDVEQFSPYEQVTVTQGDGDNATTTVVSVKVRPFPVRVRFPEAVQPTQMQLAETAKALKDAGESVLEIQRVLHPDWSERQLNENVARIQSAASIIDPVSFGVGGQDVGPGDGV